MRCDFVIHLPLTANSRDAKEAPESHKCIRAKSGVQCDQPCLIVFSPPPAFLGEISRPTRCPENLTEFPFAPNFSLPGLEAI
jgi:hypothetical protein